MSRVVVFMPSLAGGGAERVTVDLCRGLAADGVDDVTLVLSDARGELADHLPEQTASLTFVDLGSSRTATSVWPLARLLRSVRPDVVVGVLPHAGLISLAALALARVRSRTVVMVHNQMSVNVERSSRLRDRIVPLACRLGFRRADIVTAVSQGVAHDFARTTGLPEDHVTVFPNPIDFERIVRGGDEPLPDWWADRIHSRTIVAAGRLVEQKNFASLLDAVAGLSDRQVRLVILGEGPERQRLTAQASRLGIAHRVIMPGFVANPFPLFRAADLFVMSSRWEGLPTVLLEVMAFDTSIVSTDCPSGPREILDGGRYGTLVPTGDSRALSQAISSALVETTCPEKRSPVREHYSLASAVDRFRSM